jgi:hypothetical protein
LCLQALEKENRARCRQRGVVLLCVRVCEERERKRRVVVKKSRSATALAGAT